MAQEPKPLRFRCILRAHIWKDTNIVSVRQVRKSVKRHAGCGSGERTSQRGPQSRFCDGQHIERSSELQVKAPTESEASFQLLTKTSLGKQGHLRLMTPIVASILILQRSHQISKLLVVCWELSYIWDRCLKTHTNGTPWSPPTMTSLTSVKQSSTSLATHTRLPKTKMPVGGRLCCGTQFYSFSMYSGFSLMPISCFYFP